MRRAGRRRDLAAGDVLNLLTGLADKSLVVAEASADGRIRYRMLDTIREYAAAQLDEAGETERLRARFRDYAVREVEHLALIGMAIVPASLVRAGRDLPPVRGRDRRTCGRC